MPNLTVRKSGRPPKRKRSPTTPSKTSSVSKPAVKRAQKGGFRHSKDIYTVDDDDDDDEPEVIPEVRHAVKDVSAENFTVKFSCFLGDLLVYEDTNYVLLGEFSYRQFDIQCVRKVDKAAQETNAEVEWVSGQAIISGNKIRVQDNHSIIVDNKEGWRKVEKGVELALKGGKSAIHVKLTVRYKKKKGTGIVISDDDGEDLKKVFTLQRCLI